MNLVIICTLTLTIETVSRVRLDLMLCGLHDG
jgi:hypothetical protein